ncbi:MAG: hypothetical protein ACRDZO_03700 [Egibacteraceae bacterium]
MSDRFERLSFTLPGPTARRIRAAAAEQSETISGWLVQAAEHRLRLDAGRKLLTEWEAELGPVTGAERAAIAAEIFAAQVPRADSTDSGRRQSAAG